MFRSKEVTLGHLGVDNVYLMVTTDYIGLKGKLSQRKILPIVSK